MAAAGGPQNNVTELEQDARNQDRYFFTFTELQTLNERMRTDLRQNDFDSVLDDGLENIVDNHDVETLTKIVNEYMKDMTCLGDKSAEYRVKFSRVLDAMLEHEDQGLGICNGGIERNKIMELRALVLCSEAKEEEAKAKEAKAERNYMALYREFEDYHSAMGRLVDSEQAATEEKARLLRLEIDTCREEHATEKMTLEFENRRLLRDKGQLQCEIDALRAELDDTRKTLQEKSFQCDTLNRELDLIKLKDFPEMSCDKQMQAQLKASQSRVSFLDQEIQCLSGRNERLVKEMECSNDRLCSRNQELRDKIRELEQLVLDEHAGFYKKTGELRDVIKSQEIYISEVETQLKSKEDEIHEAMLETKNKVQSMMDESLQTLESMGMEKQAVLEAQELLKYDYTRLKRCFDKSARRVKAHHRFSLRLCNQGLAHLPNIPEAAAQDVATLLPDSPAQSQEDNSEHQAVENMLCEEESVLSKLYNSIQQDKTQNETLQGKLQTRMDALDENLKSEKKRHAKEILKLEEKCVVYTSLIRKLRGKLDNPLLRQYAEVNLAPCPGTSVGQGVVENVYSPIPAKAPKSKSKTVSKSKPVSKSISSTNNIPLRRTTNAMKIKIPTRYIRPRGKIQPFDSDSSITTILNRQNQTNAEVLAELQEKHANFQRALDSTIPRNIKIETCSDEEDE